MISSRTIKTCSVCEDLQMELMYLEKLNPCDQVYYSDGDAFLIQYKQNIDVFNFMPKLKLKVKVAIIGKPYSVSDKGYFGPSSDSIKKLKGLNVVLNGDDDLDLPGALTLSSHVFHNHFETFESYLYSLRSHYRYRVNKALQKSSDIEVIKIEQKDFGELHHRLYLEVFEHSQDQLECLSLEFFRTFPAELYEFRLRTTGELIGFTQVVEKSNQLTFLFGGFKHAYNKTNDLYMRMLIEIIRTGIDRGVDLIEFGQTAEETKLKLGCVAVKKYLYVHHSNRIIQGIIKKVLPLLSYKPHEVTYTVFKDE